MGSNSSYSYGRFGKKGMLEFFRETEAWGMGLLRRLSLDFLVGKDYRVFGFCFCKGL